MQKYVLWCLALAFSVSFAHAQIKPSQCPAQSDPSGCLLELAKLKAMNIRDPNKQAESLASVVNTFAQLKRTDYDLLVKAQRLVSHPKLEVARYLELQSALSAYFQDLDRKQAKQHSDLAAQLFFKAVEQDKPQNRLDLALWSCGIIDGHPGYWKMNSFITAAMCTPERMTRLDNVELNDQIMREYMMMNAAWTQSDYEAFNSAKENYTRLMAAIEADGIRRKDRKVNIATQSLKVNALSFEVEIYRRSGLTELYEKALAQAREALTGLEKLTSGEESVTARIMLADHFNFVQDFEAAIEFLRPIEDRFDPHSTAGKLPDGIHVDFLTTIARAWDAGGFRSYDEARTARIEWRKRQGDVLYEHYSYLSQSEKEKGKYSDRTLLTLRRAAEAGHSAAMHNLGVLFAHGSMGVTKDPKRALFWYAWAAQSGLAGAQNNLGDLYENGIGTPVDMGMAVYWYTQAAMQGEPTAFLSLGELFFEGKGVPQNDVTAAVWLSLAARRLPKGQNMNTAVKLRDQAIERLDEDSRQLVLSRVRNFIPLKQSEYRLGDKPQKGEAL